MVALCSDEGWRDEADEATTRRRKEGKRCNSTEGTGEEIAAVELWLQGEAETELPWTKTSTEAVDT